MLNKLNRLKDRQAIDFLMRRGKIFKTSLLIFRYAEKAEPPSQFVISVSKKIMKKAVQRNRLRRQIAAVLRFYLPGLTIPVNALLTVRSGAAGEKINFERLKQEIGEFFNRLKAHVQ